MKHLKPEYANVEEHAIPLDTPLIARLCGKSKDKLLDYICTMCTPAEVLLFLDICGRASLICLMSDGVP